jgi:hypothetical protein
MADEQQHQNPKTVKWNPQDFPTPEKPTVGIEFFNVNSGEKRVADSEALITAFYNSSNLHVNAMVGQDFGWRLAPATVKRMRDIRDDDALMDRIVTRFRLTEVSEVTDPHLLTYMFQEDVRNKARSESNESSQFARQYEDELRALDEEPTTVDPLGSLQKATATPAAKSAPRLSAAQKKAANKQAADAKRREENLAAGRDINDGIDLSDAEKKALGEDDKKLANSDENSDNGTQS